MFPGPLGLSLAGRAMANGVWSLQATNIRDYATDRHRTVDNTPFGGGAGMVLRPDVVDTALAAVLDERPAVCLTPRGRRFTQADAQRYAAAPGLVLLCGRYEGVDQRVIESEAWRNSPWATSCCRAASSPRESSSRPRASITRWSTPS